MLCFICGLAPIADERRCGPCHQEYTQYRLAAFWATMRAVSRRDVPNSEGLGQRQRPDGHEERIAAMAVRASQRLPVKG